MSDMEQERGRGRPRAAGRWPRSLSTAALVAAGALGAVVLTGHPAGAETGERIPRYDVRLAVAADGSMRVTETIVYDFGPDRRHGIRRVIPTRQRYDKYRDRRYPVSGVTVQAAAGTPAHLEVSADGDDQVLRIGDPDRTVTGRHTYTLSYTVRRVVTAYPDHVELYWNAVGDEWEVPIDAASVTVSGPGGVRQAACYAGPAGSRSPCASAGTEGGTASFAHRDLPAGRGLTVVTGFPVGAVGGTEPILTDRHDAAAAFRATPLTVGWATCLALAGILLAAGLGWRVGRDRVYAGHGPALSAGPEGSGPERIRPLRDAVAADLVYEPPAGLRPGQVGALRRERAHVVDVTATIVDLAVRGHLHIAETGPGDGPKDWVVTRRTDGDPEFLRYERELFDALFRGRDEVRLSELKDTFADDLARVKTSLGEELVRQGWYRRMPDATRWTAIGIGVALVVAACVVTVLLAVTTQVALVGVGLVAGTLALLVVAPFLPARTAQGSAVLRQVEGFRRYLRTVAADQLRADEREGVFSRNLPYAMALAEADAWAARFGELGAGRDGRRAGLSWYAGGPGWSVRHYPASIGWFTAATGGAMTSRPQAASSGSSGFSSGGASGGGGGGGGGSW
jgi:uncharacterized protein (TIGR04222 family)